MKDYVDICAYFYYSGYDSCPISYHLLWCSFRSRSFKSMNTCNNTKIMQNDCEYSYFKFSKKNIYTTIIQFLLPDRSYCLKIIFSLFLSSAPIFALLILKEKEGIQKSLWILHLDYPLLSEMISFVMITSKLKMLE